MKGILRTVTLLYCAGLAAALAGMRFVGEHHVVTATMLFLPIQGWILPACGLLLPSLIWDRRLAVFVTLVIGWFVFGYMRPEFNDWLPREAGDITVVSCNLGSERTSGLKLFTDREKPDLIALQEVNGRLHEIAAAFPEFQISGIDEFPLLSRFPILGSRIIEAAGLRRREPRAARFELDYHGRRIVVYNVHMQTPRKLLDEVYRRPEILIPGRIGGTSGQRHSALKAEWESRVSQIDQFAAILAEETLPMLVVGDFNMPQQGVNYPKLRRLLVDAFRVRGRGFGNTFPRDRSPPLSYVTPWSRLDYQFADANWRVCYFNLENGRRAQHRATVARFRLGRNYSELREAAARQILAQGEE